MFTIRGIMLDPARQLEARRVYREWLPILADLGYNTLFWHCTDDQGCALRFPSHPELASKHAYTRRETEELIEQAGKLGIAVVPEIESLGHTAWITRHRRYKHLIDGMPGKMFGAIAPLHAQTQELLTDLLTDAAEIFPAKYLHAGLDEVGFGAHPHTARLLKRRKKYELFAAHVTWVHKVISGLGKTMMMWGDHLLPAGRNAHLDREAISPKVADLVPKDIVICDWHYQPQPGEQTLRFLLGKGFTVLACPAAMCWGSLATPRDWNIQNMRDFARAAAAVKHERLLGMVTTVWCPYRNLPGPTLAAAALGASFQQSGGKDTPARRESALAKVFGFRRPAVARVALEALWQATPHVNALAHVFARSTEELTTAPVERRLQLAAAEKPLKQAARQLEAAARGVLKHPIRFDEIVFSARLLAGSVGRLDRLARVRAGLAHGEAAQERAEAALAAEAKLARGQYRVAVKHYNRTRFEDDPKRDARESRYRYFDSLLPRLRAAAELLEELAQDAKRHKDLSARLPGRTRPPAH